MERSNNGGKPTQPVESKAAWKDGAVTYFHLLFYIAISGGQIFFNKASSLTPGSTLPLSVLPQFAQLRKWAAFLAVFCLDERR
jgi:hypothetical protein